MDLDGNLLTSRFFAPDGRSHKKNGPVGPFFRIERKLLGTQIFIQENQHFPVTFNLILLLGEAMAFIVKYDVLYRNAIFLDRCNDFV